MFESSQKAKHLVFLFSTDEPLTLQDFLWTMIFE